jgi:tetratricopeptide (TPR) repeat protein
MPPSRNDPCPCGSGKKYKKCCFLTATRTAGATPPPRDSADVHYAQGTALLTQGKYPQAVAAYEKTIALDPDHAMAHMNLGNAYLQQGKFDQAVKYLERSTELDGTLPSPHANLALLYEQRGDLEKAETCVWKALERNPDYPQGLSLLASLLRGRLPEEQLDKMKELAGRADEVSCTDRANLHAWVASVHDARKEYDIAAGHMAKANALRKAELLAQGGGYDPGKPDLFVDRLIDTYTPAYFDGISGFGLDSEVPVFVVGLPRSGTTMTESILAGHPDVVGAGELIYVMNFFSSLPQITGVDADPVECIPHLTAVHAKGLARAYLKRLPPGGPTTRRVVNKQPANCLYLGLIATLFPKAKIIYVKRDPRDIAVSCWMLQFPDLTWACDKEWMAAYIRGNRRIMDYWSKVLPAPVLVVEYEKLVTDLETEARRMIDWIELPWDPACLDFHKRKGPVKTASIVQVRQPVHSRSVARWKNYQEYLSDLFDAVTGKQSSVP